jgi:pimeloyl-ACP methyl ester carboxylesterase
MTVEQFIADLAELVEAMCKRVGKNKVAIFGHSWGSALVVLYAARFPKNVAAYVGCEQIGDWPAGESRHRMRSGSTKRSVSTTARP